MLMAGSTAQAEEAPWSARLLQGGFDGAIYWGGVAIRLAPHWKTYWRVPGAGGVAPDFQAMGDNLKQFSFYLPTPKRFDSASGEAIGYKDFVVYPMGFAPTDISKALTVNVSGFMGVCDEVCIPAKFDGSLTFAPDSTAGDQLLISQWLGMSPVVSAHGPVQLAKAILIDDKVGLQLTLSEAVGDIFVEGLAQHYFQAPVFSGLTAILVVTGAKTLNDLSGQSLRITSVAIKGGLEQTIIVL